jgi:dTDP-4-amino-4,6-dideoxygalactose transaminase
LGLNPHAVTREFERQLCVYTGAPYAVAVTSCTMALLIACAYKLHGMTPNYPVSIPKRTYVSVPMSIAHAGGWPTFRDEDWHGFYELEPLKVFDSARWFSGGMFDHFERGSMVCVSFHASKVLGDTQGGAILHDDAEADVWLRRARFDGRTEGVAPKDDRFFMLGYHAYLSPDVAARLLWHLSVLPEHNEPLPNDQYPDLSQAEVFR